ncbi:MAG: hypothetical protein U0736_12845 [Gemmataceae bacterium]
MHQEALSGAAKANETLGELTRAIELYKKLADEYPSSALGQDAKKSVARLESDDGRRGYQAGEGVHPEELTFRIGNLLRASRPLR